MVQRVGVYMHALKRLPCFSYSRLLWLSRAVLASYWVEAQDARGVPFWPLCCAQLNGQQGSHWNPASISGCWVCKAGNFNIRNFFFQEEFGMMYESKVYLNYLLLSLSSVHCTLRLDQ